MNDGIGMTTVAGKNPYYSEFVFSPPLPFSFSEERKLPGVR